MPNLDPESSPKLVVLVDETSQTLRCFQDCAVHPVPTVSVPGVLETEDPPVSEVVECSVPSVDGSVRTGGLEDG